MGLLDLQTDLKTFKYGNRGLTSFPFEEPFVTVDIPATNEPLPVYPINIQTNLGQIISTAFDNTLIVIGNAYQQSFTSGPGKPTQKSPKLEFTIKAPQAGTGGPDFLVRGGMLFPTIVARDVLRMTKTLASTNGLLFTAKQKILQGTGLKPEYITNTSTGRKLLNLLTQDNTYNPINTLAQTGVVGLGGHLPRNGSISALRNLQIGGGTAGDYEPGRYIGYIEEQKQKPFNLSSGEVNHNRLVGFYQVNQVGLTTLIGAPTQAAADPNFLYAPLGGPNSVLGFGKTTIRTTKGRTGLGDLMVAGDVDAGTNALNPYLTYTQKDIYNTTPVGKGGKLQDFRKVLRDNHPNHFNKIPAEQLTILTPSLDYNSGSIEQRTLSGDPGDKTRLQNAKVKGYADVNIIDGTVRPLDKIASKEIYNAQEVESDVKNKDLVNFIIEGVTNSSPSFSDFIHFRAYLGPISDNYTAQWSDVRYVGRGEKFYTYQGFDRNISLSWVVVAQSYGELKPMIQKVNRLVSYTAPDYSQYGYMRAPLVRLTVGSLYERLPGILTQVSYEVDTNETTWETGLLDGSTITDAEKEYLESFYTNRQLPMMLKVTSFNFIPLHTFAPRRQVYTGDGRYYIGGEQEHNTTGINI